MRAFMIFAIVFVTVAVASLSKCTCSGPDWNYEWKGGLYEENKQ